MVYLISQLRKMNNRIIDIFSAIRREKTGLSRIDTAGFWSKNLLWNKPTIQESYNYIKEKYL